MEISFKGKRALVTGAGRGIGRELVKRLVECGADVVAVSRTESHLKTLKQECPKIKIIAVDVGNWEETKKALKTTCCHIGHIDLLVNNAAILEMCPFGEMTEEFVDRTINTNLKSVLNISQIVANDMKKRGKGGSIVNVSSLGSKLAMPALAVYQGLKAALDQMSRVMAVELGPYNIRVNTVNPTGVNTDMMNNLPMDAATVEQFKSAVPLRRFCEPEDIVDTIIFLLSDKAAMVHGTSIFVDGGHGTSC